MPFKHLAVGSNPTLGKWLMYQTTALTCNGSHFLYLHTGEQNSKKKYSDDKTSAKKMNSVDIRTKTSQQCWFQGQVRLPAGYVTQW